MLQFCFHLAQLSLWLVFPVVPSLEEAAAVQTQSLS